MKRVFIITIFFLFAVQTLKVFAQEGTVQMAPPLEHPKRVYVDEQKRLYIQVSLPIYLYLTTSPDANAPSYLLREKTHKYANPMYLDGPGQHTIQHPIEYRDHLHMRDKDMPDEVTAVTFCIYGDAAAPISTVAMVGAPKHTAGKTVFYGKNLQAEITTTDDSSGVQETYISIDGADFKPYRTPISFNQEKRYSLRCYAVDNVGNADTPRESRFTVDLTPPTTRHTVQNIHKDNILSPKAAIALSSSDLLAGVRRIYSTFDAQPKNTYYGGNQTLTVSQLSDGNHQLSYYSEDYVGNVEPPILYNFYLDKIPPTVTAAIIGDQYQDSKRLYISERSRIQLTATDNKAGVKHIDYEIGTSSAVLYTGIFALPVKSGTHTIQYTATDGVENISQKQTFAVYMDLMAPWTTLRFTGAQFLSPTIRYITSQTKISLSSTDNKSGVQHTKYILDGDTDISYTGSFTVAGEGSHKLTYFATDRVNNLEKKHSKTFIVDNTPPEIIHRFSLPGTSKIEVAKGETPLKQYPRHSILYLSATDQLSGVDNIFYTINGGPEQLYKSPIGFNKGGDYTVSIRVVDKLGNAGSQTILFAIN